MGTTNWWLAFWCWLFLLEVISGQSFLAVLSPSDSLLIDWDPSGYLIKSTGKNEDYKKSYGISSRQHASPDQEKKPSIWATEQNWLPPDLKNFPDIINFFPIYYKVKKGDTWFHLSHRVFPRDSAAIKRVNFLGNRILLTGEYLLIGHYLDSTKPSQVLETTESYPVFKVDSSRRILTLSGPANLFDPPISHLPYPYVLSNKIPEHAVVRIAHPMTGRTLTAKVIGKIPPGKYDLDILLVLSRIEAKKLGFLDPKFFISVTYQP